MESIRTNLWKLINETKSMIKTVCFYINFDGAKLRSLFIQDKGG